MTPSQTSGSAAPAGRVYTTLDLFAGAGGLSEGLRVAAPGRFVTRQAVELDYAAAATFALNHGGTVSGGTIASGRVYAGRIENWLAETRVPEVDVVLGGPPCQGFSTLNRARVGVERNELWRLYVETVRRASPRYFVLENVPAFSTSPQFTLFERSLRRGPLSDYNISFAVLNSADFGAPQARRRVIVIGHHKDVVDPGLPQPGTRARRTVREALEGVPLGVDRVGLPDGTATFLGNELPGVFTTRQLHFGREYTELSRRRFAAIPPGGNRFDLPDELKTPGWRKHRSGSGDVMGRLYWDRPSVTIRTEFFKPEKGRYLHPTEDRVITHYEAALLQGFPESYRWVGTREQIARQIGNAVPVPLGAAIGARLLGALDDIGGSAPGLRASA